VKRAAGLVLLAVACGPPRVTPTTPPAEHLPSDVDVDAGAGPAADGTGAGVIPRAYRLELAIDPEAAGYTGTISIDVSIGVRTSAIWLDADGPRLGRATLTVGDDVMELAAMSAAPAGRLGLALPSAVEPGDARLELTFSNDYRSEEGIFAQTYRARTYVYSDFEPVDARRGFPCFDEPIWKTPWTISLVVPAKATALSNMPEAHRTELAGDLRRVEFEPTPALPSYLIAIAVGPFETIEATGGPVPIRVVVPAGRTGAAKPAVALAPEVATIAQRFVDRPVPFPKLDIVAVPRFGGAMENPGLITVASDILLDGSGDRSERRRALVLAHEISHLWFGDSVTLADWRDLWINEGIASWMADEVLAALRPQWSTRRDELRTRDEAMADDELPGAHALRPATLDGPRSLFDVLTYQKGAALLHMIGAWVGADRLIEALRGYLDAHAGGSASSADVVSALAPLADEMRAVIEPLLGTAGVPEIAATLDCTGAARLDLAQRPDGETWQIPVCARWHDGHAIRHGCTVVGDRAEIALGATCPRWIHPDADGAGYYRWSLAGASLAAVIAAPGATDRERLDAALSIERSIGNGLELDDVAAALRAAVRSELPEVVAVAVADYRVLLEQAAPLSAHRTIAAHLRAALAPTLRRLGTAPHAGESDDDSRLRLIVLTADGTLAGEPKVIAWARKTARRWLHDHRKVPRAGLLEPALLVAGAHADERTTAALVRAASETIDQLDDDASDGGLIARALGYLPRARALRVLDTALSGSAPSMVTFALAVELLGRDDTARAAADALARRGDWLALALTFASTCDPDLLDRLAAAASTLAAGGDKRHERSLSRRKLEATRCDALRPHLATAARAFK
jgi:alanyl aminopeptidase